VYTGKALIFNKFGDVDKYESLLKDIKGFEDE